MLSGLLGGLVGHVPSSALFFAVYETTRVLYLEPVLGVGSAQSQLIASALGNVAASTIRVPTEVVKTRLQSGADPNLKECMSNIIQKDGPAGSPPCPLLAHPTMIFKLPGDHATCCPRCPPSL
jgi:solute carrier family 25 S-adenosylmethionine transporter 26